MKWSWHGNLLWRVVFSTGFLFPDKILETGSNGEREPG
jgi:hypothetical protein